MENFVCEDITMKNVRGALTIELPPRIPQQMMRSPLPNHAERIQNITIRNLTATSSKSAGVTGLPESHRGNATGKTTIAAERGLGFEIRNAKGVDVQERQGDDQERRAVLVKVMQKSKVWARRQSKTGGNPFPNGAKLQAVAAQPQGRRAEGVVPFGEALPAASFIQWTVVKVWRWIASGRDRVAITAVDFNKSAPRTTSVIHGSVIHGTGEADMPGHRRDARRQKSPEIFPAMKDCRPRLPSVKAETVSPSARETPRISFQFDGFQRLISRDMSRIDWFVVIPSAWGRAGGGGDVFAGTSAGVDEAVGTELFRARRWEERRAL